MSLIIRKMVRFIVKLTISSVSSTDSSLLLSVKPSSPVAHQYFQCLHIVSCMPLLQNRSRSTLSNNSTLSAYADYRKHQVASDDLSIRI